MSRARIGRFRTPAFPKKETEEPRNHFEFSQIDHSSYCLHLTPPYGLSIEWRRSFRQGSLSIIPLIRAYPMLTSYLTLGLPSRPGSTTRQQEIATLSALLRSQLQLARTIHWQSPSVKEFVSFHLAAPQP